jgi:hypothetical protein
MFSSEEASNLVEIDIHPLQLLIIGSMVPSDQLGRVRLILICITHTPDASRPCSPEMICLNIVSMSSHCGSLTWRALKRVDQWLGNLPEGRTNLIALERRAPWFSYFSFAMAGAVLTHWPV